MPDQPEPKGIAFPLEWNVPDNIVARYATNMVVQRGENEFIMSFFEVKPPIFLGTPDEVMQQVNNTKAIQAMCVAQIIVARDKMPSFVEALQKNLEANLKFDEGTEEE